MKNAKSRLQQLFLLALVLGWAPSAHAYTETVDGVDWTYTVSAGKASVGAESYPHNAVPTLTSGPIVIPSTLGGYAVTSIGQEAFYKCSGLTSVAIPDTVTSIGKDAFYRCSVLTNITIPTNVTSIGNGAFSGCTSLTSMSIPDSVKWIGEDAFRDCSHLTSVKIGHGVTSIGDWAFYNCSGLMNVTIGNSVTRIGDMAFSGCSSLEAFSVSSNNLAYKSISGLLLTKDGKTLVLGVNGDVVIPDGVTDISPYSFGSCEKLTSIVIPDSVVSIPLGAFGGCTKLWTAWYRTLVNLSANGGSSGGGSSVPTAQSVSLTVTNVIVHYVTPSLPSGAVTPDMASAGIVNIVAEVTANKAIAISPEWADQYPAFAATFGTDFSAALTKPTGKRDGAGNPMYVWQDYVAGTDPTDPASVFTASVTFDAETGTPVISWSPELSPAEAAKRLYTTYGKVRLTDPDWLPVADDPSPYNFFRLTVEMK